MVTYALLVCMCGFNTAAIMLTVFVDSHLFPMFGSGGKLQADRQTHLFCHGHHSCLFAHATGLSSTLLRNFIGGALPLHQNYWGGAVAPMPPLCRRHWRSMTTRIGFSAHYYTYASAARFQSCFCMLYS